MKEIDLERGNIWWVGDSQDGFRPGKACPEAIRIKVRPAQT